MNGTVAPILVTGATGNVGREVVRTLQVLGVPFVAAGTDPARVKASFGETIATVHLDLTQPKTYAAAVQGMRGLFLLRPPPISNVRETLNVLIDRAIDARVEHIAFLSVDGADQHRWVPHHAVEAHLITSGISATMLRAGFFAQNLGDAYRADIQDHHHLYVPAGTGRVAFVDVRDVAEIAARCFVDTSLRRQAWSLTGPEAVTFDEVAAKLSTCLGREIRYLPASIPGYARHLRRQHMPWMQVFVQTVLHVGLRFGNATSVDPTLSRLLGRPARSIEQYINDHRILWSCDTRKTPAGRPQTGR